VSFSRIDNVDNKVLCSVFSKSKILAAVGQCGSSKSPSLDGYNFHFLKYNWDIIGDEMINAIRCFYETGYIPRGCNASFPKKVNPSLLNEYRPISLVGCVYKVISKILANRLKRVLSKVIDNHQIDFLSGRGMLDSVLITSDNSSEMVKFNEFIGKCELVDIPVLGRRYTCYRPNGTSRSRLDRVLVSDSWLMKWPWSIQYIHSRQVSDHYALVVKNRMLDWGPKPF